MIYLVWVLTIFVAHPYHLKSITNTLRLLVPILKIYQRLNFRMIIFLSSIISLDLTSANCTCGQINPLDPQTVGDVKTNPHALPWKVTLVLFKSRPFCGGSLLNDRYILTAGQCVHNKKASQISVILGEHDLSHTNTQNIADRTLQVLRLILYPQFHRKGLTNDVALIRLKSVIIFSDTQRPPCLLDKLLDLSGVHAVFTGWDLTQKDGNYSRVMKKVDVPVINLEECKKYFGKNMKLPTSTFCGFHKHGGRDNCQIDSGIPLSYQQNDRYYLIGVVSWGQGCARPKSPAVYTRIDKYYSWISTNTVDAHSCAE